MVDGNRSQDHWPKDTEVHLLKSKRANSASNIGGGLWADAADTDLADRLRAAGR